jgi:hypothetical protein
LKVDKEDIIDLLTIVSVADRRTVGETDVELWHELLGRFSKDDCTEAIMQFRSEQPGDWLEPGHIVRRVKIMINDRMSRDDDAYPSYSQSFSGVRRDRYGYIDKSAPDDPEYPAEWNSEQRVSAYWKRIHDRQNEQTASAPEGWADDLPASDQTRAEAMEKIRAILGRTV